MDQHSHEGMESKAQIYRSVCFRATFFHSSRFFWEFKVTSSCARPRNTTPRVRNVFNSDSTRHTRGPRCISDSKSQFYRTVCSRATFSRFAGFRRRIFACYYLLSTTNTTFGVSAPILYQTSTKILGLGEICALKAAKKKTCSAVQTESFSSWHTYPRLLG